MTAETLKFGDLLIKLNLVSQQDLNDALQVAPQFGLPLGRTLVLSGRITEQELQVAVELQPLINQKNYPIESALRVVAMVRSGISPAMALKGVTANEQPAEKSSLGQLLLEAGLINQHQLEDAQRSSYQSGMRLGRILVLNAVITQAQLNTALAVQKQVREKGLSREQAVESLRAEHSAAQVSPQHAPPASSKKHVRFSEFIVSSGLATETEMLNVLETSLNKKLSLGDTLIEMGIVSKQVFDKALELYNRVSHSEMALADATAQVHKLVFGDPAHDNEGHAPVLGELLKMTGLVTDHDIHEAIALSTRYPSQLGKMLVISGALDEAILIASLRCQFLLKHGYLNVDDAIVALQYCQKNKASFDDALEELGLKHHRQHSADHSAENG